MGFAMRSIKSMKYYVEGTVTISLDCLRKGGAYKRLTLRADSVYVSLFVETPKEGVESEVFEQFVSGFYISDHALVKVGRTYKIYDALTEIGSISVKGSL